MFVLLSRRLFALTGSINETKLIPSQPHIYRSCVNIVQYKIHGADFHCSSVRHSAKKDYYSVLGVPRNASTKDIRKAYIELAKKYHPDANPGNQDAAKKFQEVADAYSVLSNKEQRQNFDAQSQQSSADFESVRRSYQSPYESFHSSVDPEELFRKIFGANFGSGEEWINKSNRAWVDYAESKAGSEKTKETIVRLTFREAAKGCEKVIKAKTLITCEKCVGLGSEPGKAVQLCPFCDGLGFEVFEGVSGRLRTTCRFCNGKGHNVIHKCSNCLGYGKTLVESNVLLPIPPGIVDGDTIKVNIEASKDAQSLGDCDTQQIFVTFRVEPSEYFSVDGFDLHSDASISFVQAILGGHITIDGLYSDEVIRIEPGTDSHTVIKLAGKGLKKSTKYGYGDHYVHLKIAVPKKLTEEGSKLLKAYAKIETETVGKVDGISKDSNTEEKVYSAQDDQIDYNERSSLNSSNKTSLIGYYGKQLKDIVLSLFKRN